MTVKTNEFQKLRAAHTSETAEDYCEMIQDLHRSFGEARLTDLAKRFGVSPATAHKIVNRLQKEKLVSTLPYRSVNLTPRGKRIASRSKKRHDIVTRFLIALGVPEKTATIDAEGMEHHCSPETLKCFQTFTQKEK